MVEYEREVQQSFNHQRPGSVTIACPRGINIQRLAMGLAALFGERVTIGKGENVNGVPVGTLYIGEL